MKNISLLERKPLVVVQLAEEPDVVDQGRGMLFKEAGDVLGYKPEENTVAVVEKKATAVAIATALKKVGCSPFTPASIKRYKDRATRFNWIANHMNLGSDGVASITAAITVMVTIVSFFVCVIAIIVAISASDTVKSHEAWMASGITGATLSFGLALTIIFFVMVEKIKIISWVKVSLKGHTGMIPDFALQTAVSLKKELPEAEFYIDICQREDIIEDPFLVMSVADVDYYLEVWDEPKFDAKRLV